MWRWGTPLFPSNLRGTKIVQHPWEQGKKLKDGWLTKKKKKEEWNIWSVLKMLPWTKVSKVILRCGRAKRCWPEACCASWPTWVFVLPSLVFRFSTERSDCGWQWFYLQILPKNLSEIQVFPYRGQCKGKVLGVNFSWGCSEIYGRGENWSNKLFL